jgi:CHAT domain-containing protein
LTRQLESIEKELSSRLGIQPKEKATLTQVMQRLTPGERYLDFARVSDGYFLFEFNASGRCAFKRFDRASSKAIDRIVQQIYRENLAIGDQKTFADIKKARTAYGRLWEILDPLMELESGESLAISPDGVLRLLAFEALYDTKSHHFLIEEKPVLYYASGRRLLERHASAKSGNLSVAVFADPKYRVKKKKASPERGLFSAKLKGAFAPLPGSLREAEMIKRLFPTARLFLEENATKKALLSLPRVDILHLATHGFFLQPRSSLPLLLRSGLVLAGSGPNGTERILTSLEAAGMDLHSTDLVVLSACYSAVGEDIGGEGMIGLYEGFKLAGAQRILQSLWGVEDRLAVHLMRGFYRRIKAGGSYAAALRKAKLSLIRQGFDHPFYWAGWRLYGK